MSWGQLSSLWCWAARTERKCSSVKKKAPVSQKFLRWDLSWAVVGQALGGSPKEEWNPNSGKVSCVVQASTLEMDLSLQQIIGVYLCSHGPMVLQSSGPIFSPFGPRFFCKLGSIFLQFLHFYFFFFFFTKLGLMLVLCIYKHYLSSNPFWQAYFFSWIHRDCNEFCCCWSKAEGLKLKGNENLSATKTFNTETTWMSKQDVMMMQLEKAFRPLFQQKLKIGDFFSLLCEIHSTLSTPLTIGAAVGFSSLLKVPQTSLFL